MNYQALIYEEIGSIARITFNRPEVRNAQSFLLFKELDAAMMKHAKQDENTEL